MVRLLINELKLIAFEEGVWAGQKFVKTPVLETGRLEHCVHCDFYYVLQHAWNNLLHEGTVSQETGISVDLNKPRP